MNSADLVRVLSAQKASNKSVARNNSAGQLFSAKIIINLIIGVIAIIGVVMLVTAILNSLVFKKTSDRDAALLASTINAMIADERPYIQVPLLLRVDGDRIVGFNTFDNQLQIPKDIPNDALTQGIGAVAGATNCFQTAPKITVATGCNDETCICASKNNQLGTCTDISTPQGYSVRLRGNYQGYKSCLQPRTDIGGFNWLPPEIQGAYTDFIVDANAILYPETVTVAAEWSGSDRPSAIVPVVVEKIVQGDTIIITVTPDSDLARARQFYLYTCPEESVEECRGKTPHATYIESLGDTYCAPGLFDGVCRFQVAPRCDTTCSTINEPCGCAWAHDAIATYGFCANQAQTHVQTNCNFVRTCEDYCMQDGSEDCSAEEQIACEYDLCGAQPFSYESCALDATNGKTECKAVNQKGPEVCA